VVICDSLVHNCHKMGCKDVCGPGDENGCGSIVDCECFSADFSI